MPSPFRDSFEFPVVGTPYLNLDWEFISSLKEGTVLRLEYEPDNPFDEHAVRVMIDDQKIGYVPNRGYSCPKCAIPLEYSHIDAGCPECGEEAVKGGMAFRLHLRDAIPDNYACFVESVNEENERVPVRVKVYVQEPRPPL